VFDHERSFLARFGSGAPSHFGATPGLRRTTFTQESEMDHDQDRFEREDRELLQRIERRLEAMTPEFQAALDLVAQTTTLEGSIEGMLAAVIAQVTALGAQQTVSQTDVASLAAALTGNIRNMKASILASTGAGVAPVVLGTATVLGTSNGFGTSTVLGTSTNWGTATDLGTATAVGSATAFGTATAASAATFGFFGTSSSQFGAGAFGTATA
jgi:hypothetical protein